MPENHKPSIIIRQDIRAGQPQQTTPQTAETSHPQKVARSERTTRRNLGKRQETLPASVLSPMAITRAETNAILDRIFTQDQSSQTTEPVTGHPAMETQRDAANEMNSAQLMQFAYYYQTFPSFDPATRPQDAAKSAENLFQYLQYGLQKLKIPMPKLLVEKSEKLKQILNTYNAKYTHLIRTSPHSISTLEEEFLRNPKVTALCTELIDDLKGFGQNVYEELADTREKEERLAILESPAGKHIQAQYPLLGQSYEAAPDNLEIAKKGYMERLSAAVEKELNATGSDFGDDPELAAQFAPKNVANFVAAVAFRRISSLVDGLNLTTEEKAEIQGQLPAFIVNQHISEDNCNVHVVFGTDKPLPARMGNEFETAVTQALLKAKLFCSAPYEREEVTKDLLLHFAHAFKGGRIQCLDNANSAITLSYKKNINPHFFISQDDFYGPVSAQDEDFFGQFLALIQKNGKTPRLKKDFQTGIQTQNTGSKTFVAYGLAADVNRSFMKTLDRLSAPAKKEGPQTPSEMPASQQLNTVPEAIDVINDLRALAVWALKETHTTITQKDAGSDALRLNNLRNLEEAHEQTRRARNDASILREQFKAWLTGKKGKTGVFRRSIDPEIDQILAQIAALEKNGVLK
jgi:hypothetical protein